MRERAVQFNCRREKCDNCEPTRISPTSFQRQNFNGKNIMKILFAAIAALALCACASDTTSQRLVETGQACAAKGKFIKVTNWENSQNFYFWDSYRQPDVEVSCR